MIYQRLRDRLYQLLHLVRLCVRREYRQEVEGV
jgi:hypothetical protein